MSHDKKPHDISDQSRRNFLKATTLGLAAAAAAQLLPNVSVGEAAGKAARDGKTLVVYYSRTGNTREIARQIHQLAGGDLVELETVTPYPTEYRATTEQAKRELQSGYRPPLKTRIANMAAYDVVLVGSPCWWGTFATPVWTFLSGHDFSGKTMAPFMTHMGSGLGHCESDLARLCPKARRLPGLAVRGDEVKSAGAHRDVEAWLRRIGTKA